MPSQESATGRSDSRRPPFQYSLATMLVVTVVAAVACTIFFAFPAWVGLVAALCVVIFTPVVLTIVVIHRPGYARTFCTGALFPASVYFVIFGVYGTFVPLALVSGEVGYGPFGYTLRRTTVPILLAVYWGLVILGGLVAVFVRWRLEAPKRLAARESHPAEGVPDAGAGNVHPPETSQ